MQPRRNKEAVRRSLVKPLMSSAQTKITFQGQRLGRMFVVAVMTAMTILGVGLGSVAPSYALGAPARYADSPLDQTQIQSIRPAWGNRAGPASSGTGGGGGFDLSRGIGFEFSGPHYARGVYREATLDLVVKVAGGYVKIRRLWQGGRWTFNPAWSTLRWPARW